MTDRSAAASDNTTGQPPDSATRKVNRILHDAFVKAYPRVLPDDWGDDESDAEEDDS